MKKILFILAMSASSFAFAASPVNGKTLETFRSTFANASNVSWTEMKKENLVKASFQMYGRDFTAVFSDAGELLATASYIDRSAMPVMLSRKINRMFPGYHVNTVIEKTTADETTYVITLDSEKQGLVVTCTDGDITITKKIKK
jgi:hypothetical protein